MTITGKCNGCKNLGLMSVRCYHKSFYPLINPDGRALDHLPELSIPRPNWCPMTNIKEHPAE